MRGIFHRMEKPAQQSVVKTESRGKWEDEECV